MYYPKRFHHEQNDERRVSLNVKKMGDRIDFGSSIFLRKKCRGQDLLDHNYFLYIQA